MAPSTKERKAPTKHGLEKKFKPWRRGESSKHTAGPSKTSKSSVKSSLKNKLRSEKRRLQVKDLPASVIASITENVKTLEAEIAGKAVLSKERDNATKYHKIKFFERRKLMRMENKVKGMEGEMKERAEKVVKEG